MPVGVVKTAADERHWDMAKKAAAKEGRAKDWAYIMGIFKKMSGKSEAVQEFVNTLVGVDEMTTSGAIATVPMGMKKPSEFSSDSDDETEPTKGLGSDKK